MRTSLISGLIGGLLVAAVQPLAAQQFVPTGPTGAVDSSTFTIFPMGGDENARVQWFYDQARSGFAGPTTISSMDLRWDGPLPKVGSPAPITAQRIEIFIGVSSVGRPAANFAENLSQPLTKVFDGPRTYFPDQGSLFPEPWGGLNGGLSFPFSQPVTLQVDAGEWLVVEMRVRGNLFPAGFTHTILDAESGAGGPVDGTTVDTGVGCAIPSVGTPLTCGSELLVPGFSGETARANGASFFLTASGLVPNGFGVLAVGTNNQLGPLGPLPTPLPGTGCTLYTSGEFLRFVVADATGSVTPFTPGASVALPYRPVLTGFTIYAQVLAPAAALGPFGLAASNAHEITLGDYTPLTGGLYSVINRNSADATDADRFEVKAPAIRFQ